MSKTLLIVDDSALIRKSVVKVLEPTQIFSRILQAKNGLEALEILLKEEIDLLLSDVNMDLSYSPRFAIWKNIKTCRSFFSAVRMNRTRRSRVFRVGQTIT